MKQFKGLFILYGNGYDAVYAPGVAAEIADRISILPSRKTGR